jgi:hypothetical protein
MRRACATSCARCATGREAAWQIRPFFGAALHITTSSFGLADLLDTDPARIRTGEFEAKLGEQIHSHGQTGR